MLDKMPLRPLPFDMDIVPLRFTLEADTLVHLGAQAGAQIRGALWQVLEAVACSDPANNQHPDHAQVCPACFLLALRQEGARGQDPARPFAVRPPLVTRADEDRFYPMGEQFIIGITLFGRAITLLPYVIQGIYQIGQQGLGYGRGCYHIVNLEVTHIEQPATSLWEAGLVVPQMQLPHITTTDIERYASQHMASEVHLRFLTPTQIKHEGRFLERPDFSALFARLLERAEAIAHHYGMSDDADTEGFRLGDRYESLRQQANAIQLVRDHTHFVQYRSGSRRTGYRHTIGGWVGSAYFEGDFRALMPWIVLGQWLQVGKNAVKGAGWYEIAPM